MNSQSDRFKSEKLLEILSVSQNATAIYTGENLLIQSANDVMISYWNKDRSVVGKTLAEAVPELVGQPFIGILQNVWRTGVTYETKNVAAALVVNGGLQTFYFNFVYRAIKDEQGNIDCILHTATDMTEFNLTRNIAVQAKQQLEALNQEQLLNEKLATTNTELQQAQQELQQLNDELEARVIERTRALADSEERLGMATEAAQIGTWFIHPQTKSLQYNAKLAELFGYTGKENMTYDQAIGQVTEEYRPVILKAIEEAINGGGHYDITYQQRRFDDNRLIWLRSLGRITKDSRGAYTLFSGIVNDVSEQVQAQQEIKMSEQRLSLAIASAKLGTWYIDVVTNKFIASPRLKEMFGFYADEEMTYEAAVGLITDEHRETVLNAINAVLHLGQDYDIEYPVVGHHDGILRWVRATGKLFRGENGQPSSFSGTMADITEQKADEQRKNDFIGMVSHELKTPLTTVGGYLQILRSKAKKGDSAGALNLFDKADVQLKKMTAMINGFLNVSRLESGKIHIDKNRFDIANLVKESEEESLATITSHHVVFAPVEETFVLADRDKISHVISNLMSNAVKYSPAGSTINVACVKINGMAQISVKDQGLGIAPEDLDKLFDRYYRTENAAFSLVSGFGIGLYLSAEIVHRHEGRIWAESQIGKGSTFFFTLPVIT